MHNQTSPGELAPELNKNNKKRALHSENSKEYSTVHFEDATAFEKESFLKEFAEFVKSSHFDNSIVHLIIPDALYEDVTLEITAKSFVQFLEHVVELRENDLYRNKQRVGVRYLEDVNEKEETVIYE
eukprot:Awhi_evm1s9591